MKLQHDPRREALNNEVHARPSAPLSAPARASHLAVLWGEGGGEADSGHLAALCARQGAPPPPPGATHFVGDFGAFRLKWERHTEFSTYTFLREGGFTQPFADTAIARAPRDWLETMPGKVLVGAHVAFMPAEGAEPDAEAIARALVPDTTAGSRMAGGGAMAWTDFRLHEDGFGRILVRGLGAGPRQAGRLVQRLLEIETYRMMALLALPAARAHTPRIAALGEELAQITEGFAAIKGLEDERRALDRLIGLAAEVERIAAATAYRFGAGRAYYALVLRRIAELREERIEGTQTIAEFMDRRLAPAMRTVESVGERLEAIANRVNRASRLLSSRVDVSLEAQNRDLLASMNRRALLQLRLQQTVEGLSVAAITYYVVGLVGHAAKAAKTAGLAVDADLAAGLAILPVAVAVWWAVRRLRKRLKGD